MLGKQRTGQTAPRRARAFSVPIESERRLSFLFDAFSSREPVSTPDHVRGRLSLENAVVEWKRDANVRIGPRASALAQLDPGDRREDKGAGKQSQQQRHHFD